MGKPRSSERRARDLAEELVKEAKEIARSGGDVSPGTTEFWKLLGSHIEHVGSLLTAVQVEVWQEQQAGVEETRECVVCGGEIIKKHKRGRWPIYCDVHSLGDRKSVS